MWFAQETSTVTARGFFSTRPRQPPSVLVLTTAGASININSAISSCSPPRATSDASPTGRASARVPRRVLGARSVSAPRGTKSPRTRTNKRRVRGRRRSPLPRCSATSPPPSSETKKRISGSRRCARFDPTIDRMRSAAPRFRRTVIAPHWERWTFRRAGICSWSSRRTRSVWSYGWRIIAHPLKFVHSPIRSTPLFLFANSLSIPSNRGSLSVRIRESYYSQTGLPDPPDGCGLL